MTSPDLSKGAFRLAMRGLAVFPLAPGAKVPPKGSNGFHDAVSYPDVTRARWTKSPNANIGVATGAKSGIWALDVDLQHGGVEALQHLVDQHGALSATVKVLTPSGGFHLWWRWPDEPEIRNSCGRVGPGIDVRGEGGSIIAPPSVLADGRHYRWAPDSGKEIALAPSWLVKLTQRPEPPPRPAPKPLNGDVSAYVGAAVANELRTLQQASEGCRNHTLFKTAARLAGFIAAEVLPEDWARAKLETIAESIGLDPVETRKTIESGICTGIQNPRDLPT